MTEQEALAKMVPPAGARPNKPYRGGVIQVLVTSSCDKQCFGCTQGSQLRRKPWFMTPDQYGQALESLRGYWGVVGMFGGNPAVSPYFEDCCKILRESWVPLEQRGIWSNNPLTTEKAAIMRQTFNPRYSNLNVHLDDRAFGLFKDGWPEAHVVGLFADSRHSPPFVAMRDLDVLPSHPGQDVKYLTKMPNTEENRWDLIADCDINQRWSAGIGVFRGQLRGYFCEVAMAQSILHQDEPYYPDTGRDLISKTPGMPDGPWWKLEMGDFSDQVRKHCHECSVPLRGFGELSQADLGTEQTSQTHAAIFHPKRKDRLVQIVTDVQQLGVGRLTEVTRYIQNGGIK